MDEIKYSVEQLYHFNCIGGCKLWWTVGDFPKMTKEIIFCPHCGKKYKFSKDAQEQKVFK